MTTAFASAISWRHFKRIGVSFCLVSGFIWLACFSPQGESALPRLQEAVSSSFPFPIEPLLSAPSGINRFEFPGRPGASVKKCCIVWDATPQAERALLTHRQHAEQHGYPQHITLQKLMDEGRLALWSKVVFHLSMLVQELSKPPEQRVEWLFFFDADTIILNPNIPLSAFLPPDVAPDAASKSEFNSSSIHFLPNADGGGINIGTFFLRVHPWSLAFLLRVLELPHVRPELKIEESWNTEQNAYKHAAAEADHREHIRYIPRHWINAYEVNRADSEESIFDGLTGDLLVHFPGLRADTRRAHMDAWFEELENHPAKWRVPFKETTIEAETKAYWYSLAVAEHVLQRLSKTLDTKLIAGGSDRETVGRLDTAMKELQSVIWGKANDWNAITKLTEDVQAYTE